MYVCTEVAKAWFAESLLRSLKIAYRREGPIPVAEIYCQYYMFISCAWDRRPVYILVVLYLYVQSCIDVWISMLHQFSCMLRDDTGFAFYSITFNEMDNLFVRCSS